VLVLDADNFDAAVAEYGTILAEFYAPVRGLRCHPSIKNAPTCSGRASCDSLRGGGGVLVLVVVVCLLSPQWCGHCKKLAPEYVKAAAELRGDMPPIRIAKIDADASHNKALAARFGVSGFPTLKVVLGCR